MKTQDVKLYAKTGEVLNNDDMVYLSNDDLHLYPIRRIVRWALQRTAKDLEADCAGMGGEGNFDIEVFWNYFNDSFSELTAELSGDTEFERILIERFDL